MRAVKTDIKDNVAVVIQDTPAGSSLVISSGESLYAADDIPAGHKVALCDIERGEPVVKFGRTIGIASRDIKTGEYLHCHNIEDITDQLCDAFTARYLGRPGA